MTQGEILRLIAPKKQTIADAPTLSIDCKAAKYSIIEIGANRVADFLNFNTDLEGHILQVKHLVAGTSITLPGSNNISGNWAENANDITMVACFYNGTSWIFELTPVLAGDVAPTPTLSAPTNLVITPSDSLLGLDWDNVPNATGYVVQRATDAGFTANLSTTNLSGGTNSSYNQFASPNGTLFYVRVKATAAGYNDSPWTSGSGTPSAGSSYDADAQAYFTAAGVTDTTEKNLWNDFVVGAKADGFWNDIDVLNPLLGSAAAATAVNAKNPAAHGITWTGGVTHNAMGVTGNGTNGRGVMAYNPSTQMSVNGGFACAYIVSAMANNPDQMVAFGVTESDSGMYLVPDYFNITFGLMYNQTEALNQNSTTSRTGIMILNRTSNSSAKFWRNGVQIEEVTGSPVGPISGVIPNYNIGILALNDANTFNSYSTNTIGFLAFGPTGLNDTKRAQFEARLQTLMTGLGR